MESPPAGRVCTGMAELGGAGGALAPPLLRRMTFFLFLF